MFTRPLTPAGEQSQGQGITIVEKHRRVVVQTARRDDVQIAIIVHILERMILRELRHVIRRDDARPSRSCTPPASRRARSHH